MLEICQNSCIVPVYISCARVSGTWAQISQHVPRYLVCFYFNYYLQHMDQMTTKTFQKLAGLIFSYHPCVNGWQNLFYCQN